MDDVLFANEVMLLSQPASLLLGAGQTERPPAPMIGAFASMRSTADALVRGMEGTAIEGDLYLTSDRFYFASHGENWSRGSYSIFLPTIRRDAEADGLLSDHLVVESRSATHRFQLRDAHSFREVLHDPTRPAPDLQTLRIYAKAEPDRVGRGIAALWHGAHPEPEVLSALEAAVAGKQANALQALAVLTALELYVD